MNVTDPLASRIDLVAIGASMGAIDAFNHLLPAIPAAARYAVVVVVHLPEHTTTSVHRLFADRCRAAVKEAEDKESIQAGAIYFAPAGYHLLVEPDRSFGLSVDEPVHFSRPSIDVLFESVAEVYSAAAMGIILTGASADGAAGLAAIHHAGGLTVVQSPDTARAPVMPEAALKQVQPSAILSLEQIHDLFASGTVR